MSKMSEMEATIRELRDIASSINDIANWLTDAFGSADDAEAAPAPAKTYSLEEVRAILAEKSRDGFTARILLPQVAQLSAFGKALRKL